MLTPFFECGRYRFSMKVAHTNAMRTLFKPLVMGILNVTPDSFSDGGKFQSLDHAITHAEQMIEDGVDIIDIGGESSRPGAKPLPLDEELKRVIPLIYALRDCGKPISIDTYKPEVMREAIIAGADMINDIRGFDSEQALAAVADSDVGLCVMHMQKSPETMQEQPSYQYVTQDVIAFLRERCDQLEAVGVEKNRISVDPGFGFGKTLEHNIELLQNINVMQEELGFPVLAGISRKTMIGAITGKPVEHRMAGSLAAALAAMAQGARILRVHDVAETVDAIKVWHAANTIKIA
ncbi:dihydropteroate synthase [Undibacterium seohonense]|uniref:Dihydropteroate synthase n=1 Tax=Undibacterium seohonense TaxID=1344950 RepID=A0ABR6WZ30_9BURK|nr:dihydropteroate synthase [Undibacterium seohonense]